MIEYKGFKFWITEEPPKHKEKDKIYQYSLSLDKPLKIIKVNSFKEARKKIEKYIDEKLM